VFAKIAFVILCVGVTACALLAARQLRMQAAHDLAAARLRILDRDEDLWRLRARIAATVTPANVERMAGELAPLQHVAPGNPSTDPR